MAAALGAPIRRADRPNGTVHVTNYQFNGVSYALCGLALVATVVPGGVTCRRCLAILARDPNLVQR